MSVLQYVKIENFRSIRVVTLEGIADYNPIIGLNSAGKSNVLRALNLFFNGLVDEEGAALDFGYDYSSYAPSGKKKRVAVTVGISLGSNFQVPRQREFEKKHGLKDAVYIRRTWNLAPDNLSNQDFFEFGASSADLQTVAPDELSAILAYIRAVRFVYIPNHARPADLIRSELAPLRSALVARLRRTTAYKDASVADVLEELGVLGERMFGNVSELLQAGLPGTSIAPDLPLDFADLVFDVGVNAISSGEARPPEFEGSGAQSFMLLHILDLADRTRRAGGFGWVQASVWAVEEPESFLHAGLRARFSADLFDYSQDDRRQIFLTTHQDEFVRVAQAAWFTTNSPDDGTSVVSLPTREALSISTKTAVTTFRHPLFVYPDVPIVIVEGKWDDVHLRAGLAKADRRPRWRLLSPSQALDSEIGGDGVLPYLKYNRNVIASRPDAAPVIVLRDWEDSNIKPYAEVLKVHSTSVCLIPPDHLANPQLDQSFVGIERFLGTDLTKDFVPKNELGLEHAGKGARFRVKRTVLEGVKKSMALAVEGGRDPGPYMVGLAEWLDDEVTATLAAIPAAAFQ